MKDYRRRTVTPRAQYFKPVYISRSIWSVISLFLHVTVRIVISDGIYDIILLKTWQIR